MAITLDFQSGDGSSILPICSNYAAHHRVNIKGIKLIYHSVAIMAYSVTVAQNTLTVSVQVRILVSQL